MKREAHLREPGRPPRSTALLPVAAALVGIVALAGVAACSSTPLGSGPPASDASSPEPRPSPSGRGTLAPGPGAVASAAPEFTLPTIGGGTLSSESERGRVLVLNFTAPDCPTCAEQVPVLDSVAARFASTGTTVAIVDVSGLDDDSTLANAYRDYGWTERVPIAKDRTFEVAQAFRVTRMSETVILDREGAISWQGVWEDEEVLVQAIERAGGS